MAVMLNLIYVYNKKSLDFVKLNFTELTIHHFVLFNLRSVLLKSDCYVDITHSHGTSNRFLLIWLQTVWAVHMKHAHKYV